MSSIRLKDVSVEFPVFNANSRSLQLSLYHKLGAKRRKQDITPVVKALSNINVSVAEGERVALVGHNGAGKTTLLRVMSGVYPVTSGSAEISGSVSALTDISLGMDPEASGYENIIFRLVFMGLTFKGAQEKISEIAEFTELNDFLRYPVRTYSTGMHLRLAFAISTIVQPEILILDEMLNTGDAAFQDKARKRIDQILKDSKVLVISTHDHGLVRSLCNRAIWLNKGQVLADGRPDDVIASYLAHSRSAH